MTQPAPDAADTRAISVSPLSLIGTLTYVFAGATSAIIDPELPLGFWITYALGAAAFLALNLVDSQQWERALSIVFAIVCVALPMWDTAEGLTLVPSTIAAPTIALVFGQRMALGYIVALVLVLAAWFANGGFNFVSSLVLYNMLNLFAVFAVSLFLREAAAREALAAAQEKLAETARASERLRISRDLHDRVGHQLSALAVNLEAATHLAADTPAHESIEQSRVLAKHTLAEIRAVVSQIRDEDPSHLIETELRAFADRIPSPTIIIDADPLHELSRAASHQIILAIREAITNAVRHSGASTVTVAIRQNDGMVHARIRDDGAGAPGFTFGSGLTGMVERVEELGGSVEICAGPPGFTVDLRVPAGGSHD